MWHNIVNAVIVSHTVQDSGENDLLLSHKADSDHVFFTVYARTPLEKQREEVYEDLLSQGSASPLSDVRFANCSIEPVLLNYLFELIRMRHLALSRPKNQVNLSFDHFCTNCVSQQVLVKIYIKPF